MLSAVLRGITRFPNAIAMMTEQRTITYQELNERSQSLTQALLDLPLQGTEHLVIYLNDPIDTVIGMIGALKAGITFIPIDITYPMIRVKNIIKSIKQVIILTDHSIDIDQHNNTKILRLDKLFEMDIQQKHVKPFCNNTPYILFTSGSTGTPKGAQLLSHGIENLLKWYENEFDITHKDCFLSCTPLGFDLTLKNVFVAMQTSAQIFFLSPHTLDAGKAVSVINEHRISLINCTPTIFYAFIDSCSDINLLSSLRYILLGGERIKPSRLRALTALYPHTTVVNTYGPTECSDIATIYRLTAADLSRDQEPPIGKPIENVKLTLLDINHKPVKDGQKGILFISGTSLGGGYINDSDLNKAKFPNIKLKDKDKFEKYYDTGDIVTKSKDGYYYFVDRVDNQIKLNGLRIEIGEIEHNLLLCDNIKDAVVITQMTDRATILVAFILPTTPPSSGEKFKQQIVSTLVKLLPRHMIPHKIIIVNNFPKNDHGKVNRKQLTVLANNDNNHEASLTTTKIIKIFSGILNIPKEEINSNSNFFDLGGYSLDSFRLIAKIAETFNKNITYDELIVNATPAKIEPFISNRTMNNNADETQPTHGRYPLSTTQKRYLHNFLEQGTSFLNLPAGFIVNGDLEPNLLKQVYLGFIHDNPILRSQLAQENNNTYFRILPKDDYPCPFKLFDLSTLHDKEQKKYIDFKVDEAVSDNLLAKNTLLCSLTVFKCSQQKHVLLFNFHHSIFDGGSWNILKRYISDNYNHSEHSNNHELSRSYEEFVALEVTRKPTQDSIDEFYKFILKNNAFKPSSDIKHTQTHLCFKEFFSLKGETYQAINHTAETLGVSLNSCFYSIFHMALELCHLPLASNNIAFIFSNRMSANFSETVGLFTKLLPCKFKFDNVSIRDRIKEANEYFRELLLSFPNVCVNAAGVNYTTDTLFVFQNTDNTDLLLKECKLNTLPIKYKYSTYKFELHIWPTTTESYELELVYNPCHLTVKDIVDFIKAFSTITKNAAPSVI